MNFQARQQAKLNRKRREREREREEFLCAHASNPAFHDLKAAMNAGLADRPPVVRPAGRLGWGARGPRYDPARVLRDALVAFAVESALSAGRPYEEAIAAGVTALRQRSSGASSPKTVEAILTKQRRLRASGRADLANAQRVLREYGLDV
jgi:hypothetical protein